MKLPRKFLLFFCLLWGCLASFWAQSDYLVRLVGAVPPQPSVEASHSKNQTTSTPLVAPPAVVDAWIADMDVMTACGHFKCYFPSRSATAHTQTGWLVTRSRRYYRHRRHTLSFYPASQQTYDFARAAYAMYGMRHLLLAPPPFTTGRLSVAQSTALWHTKFNATACRVCGFRSANHTNEGFIVQRVQQFPAGAILLKLEHPKKAVLTPPLNDDWWRSAMGRNIHNQTTTAATFWQNFQTDLRITRRVLHDYPGLLMDFQCLLTLEGHLIHIDLDRQFDAALLYRRRWRQHFITAVEPALAALEHQIGQRMFTNSGGGTTTSSSILQPG